MQIHIISLFPEIFDSFLSTSLINKAQNNKSLNIFTYNPREFCKDKHQQIDDEIYGGGAGMLIKAEPIIDCVENVISKHNLKKSDFKILFPAPAKDTFTQKNAYTYSKQENLIFVCGRYEGIDYRRELYMQKHYPNNFEKISLGSFILLGGEVATMTMIESIVRLVPGVIKESESRQDESYNIKYNMENLEEPHYTRPEIVKGFAVPDILLKGNLNEIKDRKEKNTKFIK